MGSRLVHERRTRRALVKSGRSRRDEYETNEPFGVLQNCQLRDGAPQGLTRQEALLDAVGVHHTHNVVGHRLNGNDFGLYG